MKMMMVFFFLFFASKSVASCKVPAKSLKSSVIKAKGTCFDPESWMISSKDCRISVACPLIHEMMRVKPLIHHSEVGNPSYALCRSIKGETHQLEALGKKGFEPVSVCIKGKSFIDMNRLSAAFQAMND